MDIFGDFRDWIWFAISVAVFAIGASLYAYRQARQRLAAERKRVLGLAAVELATKKRRAARKAAIKEAVRNLAVKAAEEVRLEAERVERVASKARRLAQVEGDRVKAADAAFDAAALAASVQRKRFHEAREDAIHKARAALPPLSKSNAPAEPGQAALGVHEQSQKVAQSLALGKTPAQTLVLIADDSKVVRVKTGRLLGEHHYKVIFAVDGLDAVQLLQSNVPDVVITDVEMPGLDGFQLARHIRGNAKTSNIPIIMITAADERHRGAALKAGVSAMLSKPFADSDLIDFIKSAMMPVPVAVV